MNRTPREKLYSLLPAIYRRRDVEQGEPLRALLAVLESQLERVEGEIDALYDNWFIETCEHTIIPLLGQLLGDPLAENGYESFEHPRRWVARLQDLRRQKGTAGALELAIACATGWQALCVELQRQLVITPRIDTSESSRGCSVDVRNVAALHQVDGPFNTFAHRVDVRRIENGHGRFNLRNLGIYLWRMTSEPAINVRPAPAGLPGCFTFDPLGIDIPLFQRPLWRDQGSLPNERHLPGPISACLFADNPAAYYGSGLSLAVYYGEQLVPVSNIVPRDLSTWDRTVPASARKRAPFDAELPVLLMDVERGRFAVALSEPKRPGSQPSSSPIGKYWLVSFHQGRSAQLGGGFYSRDTSLIDPQTADWQPKDAENGISSAGLDDAVRQFNEKAANGSVKGLIRINDNVAWIAADSLKITLPKVGWLAIEAADGARPCLQGRSNPLTIHVSGGGQDSILILNGLLIRGQINIVHNSDESTGTLNLHLRHSTVTGGIRMTKPKSAAIKVRAMTKPRPDDLPLGMHLESSIVGPIALPQAIVGLSIRDCIIDHRPLVSSTNETSPESFAISNTSDVSDSSYGPPLEIERSTVFGQVRVRQLTSASDVLFAGTVEVERRDVGTVSQSYLPQGNLSDLSLKPARAPVFVSQTYGHPQYAQLRPDNDSLISRGAHDGSEIGVFGPLQQGRRESALRELLDDWVPVELHPGLIYLT